MVAQKIAVSAAQMVSVSQEHVLVKGASHLRHVPRDASSISTRSASRNAVLALRIVDPACLRPVHVSPEILSIG